MKLKTGAKLKLKKQEKGPLALGYSLDPKQAVHWLQSQNVRVTPLRQALLEFFLSRSGVVSLEELQQALSHRLSRVDRVSVYRTLRLFEELKWIHKVADGRFMFCRHHCARHAHWMLSCELCGQVRELSDHRMIAALTPWLKHLGLSERHDGLIVGVCAACAKG